MQQADSTRDVLLLARSALSVSVGLVSADATHPFVAQVLGASDAFGCDDAAADARYARFTLPDGAPLRFFVAAPIVREGRAIAALVFADPTPRALREDDVARVQGAARVLATIAETLNTSDVHRMKSEFVSVVSHELRTPLTSIRGALGLLESGVVLALPEEGLNLVRIARTNADRLIRLVNDILDIDKIESGKLELHRRDVSAHAMVEHALDALRPIAEESKVTFASHVDRELRLIVDEDRVVQLINNLVSNAIKFSPENGVVHVRLARRGPRTARLTVRDEGPGIAPELVPRLFGKFQQLDASDRRARGGSGLGLAISKAIAEQHGGAIGVETRPGEGATFFVDLPAVAVSSSRAVVLGPRRMVLVVDGPGGVAKPMSSLVKDGFVTARAHDLAEAERWLDTSRPATIVVDVDNGDASGVDASPMELLHQLEGRFGVDELPRFVLAGTSNRPLPVEWVVDPIDQQRMKHALRWKRQDGAPLRVRLREDDPSLRGIIAAGLGASGVELVDDDADVLVGPASLFARECPQTSLLVIYGQRDLDAAERSELSRGLGACLRRSAVSDDELLRRIRSLLAGVLPS